jgi:hypothetical protein
MILATALLAGSLIATGAQARGGGGGHGGGMGGGHMGGFGGGMGGFSGGHMGGFGGGRIGGPGEDHIGGLGAGRMANAGHPHPDGGRRRFLGNGFYDNGLDCPYNPYYTSYNWPYTCTY